MVFSSPIFLFVFLIMTLSVYAVFSIFRNIKLLNFILLLFSFLFYAYGCASFMPILIISLLFNYTCGLLMKYFTNKKHRFMVLVIAVVINIFILFYYKYLNLFTNLFIDIINFVINGHIKNNIFDIVLPIGISFYTFQILSYVIDVYRKKVKANKNFFDLALYAMFFPQLIAGPIVRYSDIKFRLDLREHSFDNVYTGFRRFVIGFVKKVLFANYMGGIADIVFNGDKGNFGFFFCVFGAICYSMQIFLDFSAYSDMAIGLAKVFAFDFKENFNYPFLSSGMREMWQRWHISLSSFFKDYVYIPLGGSRKGLYRRCKNLLYVFLLSGFWHGANWNYLIWGIYNGVLVVIDTLIDIFFKTFKDNNDKVYSVYMFINKRPVVIVRIVFTFIIWTIGMVIFRCESLSTFTSYVYTLTHPMKFNIVTREIFKKVFNGYFVLVLIGVIGYATRIWKNIEDKIKDTKLNIVSDIFLILLFIYAIIEMICSGFNPFIYFRF